MVTGMLTMSTASVLISNFNGANFKHINIYAFRPTISLK